jgi:hypothetical protein
MIVTQRGGECRQSPRAFGQAAGRRAHGGARLAPDDLAIFGLPDAGTFVRRLEADDHASAPSMIAILVGLMVAARPMTYHDQAPCREEARRGPASWRRRSMLEERYDRPAARRLELAQRSRPGINRLVEDLRGRSASSCRRNPTQIVLAAWSSDADGGTAALEGQAAKGDADGSPAARHAAGPTRSQQLGTLMGAILSTASWTQEQGTLLAWRMISAAAATGAARPVQPQAQRLAGEERVASPWPASASAPYCRRSAGG